jgi:hypothetical protein
MSQAEDDLKQAVVNLGAAVNGATAEISSLSAQLLAANTANDSAGVEAIAQQITTIAASLNASVAAAQPAPVVPAATVPAPAAEPAPAPAPAPAADVAPAPAPADPAAPTS